MYNRDHWKKKISDKSDYNNMGGVKRKPKLKVSYIKGMKMKVG